MPDPNAHYTETGDRILLLCAADRRRLWLSDQLARWARWAAAARRR